MGYIDNILKQAQEKERSRLELSEIRKVRMVEGIVLEGKSATKAAQEAGFGVKESLTPWKLVPPDEMRRRFQEIAERKGLTLDKVGDKVLQHLEARANQTNKVTGEIEQSDAPDYRTQQKAIEQLTGLLGVSEASKAAQGASTVTLSISGPAADRLAAMLGGE